MSILEHLEAFRKRLIRASLGVAVGALVSFLFIDPFLAFVFAPLRMVLVFQMPTVVFFLARMRMVTARFLARNTKYAILIIFIVAAVLTPDGSPWNQTLFAAPMIGLYVLSIGIAWVVAPRQT